MRILKITWVRVIVSFFAGGILNETLFLCGGDVTRPRSDSDESFVLLYALIIYFVITWYVNRFVKNTPPPL